MAVQKTASNQPKNKDDIERKEISTNRSNEKKFAIQKRKGSKTRTIITRIIGILFKRDD